METIEDEVVAALRRMDAEAGPRADGKATGLWWYGGHARPDLRRPQTEVEWSRRLGDLLRDGGRGVRREVRYPGGSRDRCDLVIDVRDRSGPLWLEVKGAWKDWWMGHGGAAMFRSYLLHPLVPAPSLGRRHTAALDVQKLARLDRTDAAAVGLLLVAFDVPSAPVTPDLTEFARLAGLDAAPWRTRTAEWPDVHAPSRTVHVRLWTRPTT